MAFHKSFKKSAASLLLLVSLGADAAQNGTAAPYPHNVRYVLKNLQPVNTAVFENAGREIDHEYLHFKNSHGDHYLIYEDSHKTRPLEALRPVREIIGKPNTTCEMELACTTNAFCTGTCKNFYYELSNLAPDPSRPMQNHCELRVFHCKEMESGGKPK